MTIPVLAIFNATNRALRSALYNADRELYGEAEQEVAVAFALVQLLQTYNPPHGRADPPSESMKHRMTSLSGVTVMFHYQVRRWDINPAAFDNGLFMRSEES